MAVDHSRLGLENKFLEKKSGRIFGVRQVLTLQNPANKSGSVYTNLFILFVHHI